MAGKSSLLNALGAEPPKKSKLAAVHARAGWTAHLSFVRVVKAGHERGQGAVMLVDTPGYGFSVGANAQLRHLRALPNLNPPRNLIPARALILPLTLP